MCSCENMAQFSILCFAAHILNWESSGKETMKFAFLRSLVLGYRHLCSLAPSCLVSSLLPFLFCSLPGTTMLNHMNPATLARFKMVALGEPVTRSHWGQPNKLAKVHSLGTTVEMHGSWGCVTASNHLASQPFLCVSPFFRRPSAFLQVGFPEKLSKWSLPQLAFLKQCLLQMLTAPSCLLLVPVFAN